MGASLSGVNWRVQSVNQEKERISEIDGKLRRQQRRSKGRELSFNRDRLQCCSVRYPQRNNSGRVAKLLAALAVFRSYLVAAGQTRCLWSDRIADTAVEISWADDAGHFIPHGAHRRTHRVPRQGCIVLAGLVIICNGFLDFVELLPRVLLK